MSAEPEAKNVAAIRRWLTKHRPDVTDTFDSIVWGEAVGNDRMRALFGLMAIAFAAGREYQQEHPTDKDP